jgi:hypothetical protein
MMMLGREEHRTLALVVLGCEDRHDDADAAAGAPP